MVRNVKKEIWTLAISATAVLLAACGPAAGSGGARVQEPTKPIAESSAVEAPALEPIDATDGRKLRVATTTGIVADVVRNVGGDAIEVTALIPVGADPHSYTPTPQDLRDLNNADVVFVNGLGLEESLLPILQNLDRPVPLVSVNMGVETLILGDSHRHDEEEHGEDTDGAAEPDDEGHEAGSADPHTWFSVPNVMTWTENVTEALSALDPAKSDVYATGAAAYLEKLAELDAELRAQADAVPADRRKLVTDHVALAYFAAEYGFETVGSVLPSLSTLAAASAQELAALQEAMEAEGVRAVFVGTTVNAQTARQLASDLGIPVVELYTGSLSEEGGPAATYVELMQYDAARIVEALR